MQTGAAGVGEGGPLALLICTRASRHGADAHGQHTARGTGLSRPGPAALSGGLGFPKSGLLVTQHLCAPSAWATPPIPERPGGGRGLRYTGSCCWLWGGGPDSEPPIRAATLPLWQVTRQLLRSRAGTSQLPAIHTQADFCPPGR